MNRSARPALQRLIPRPGLVLALWGVWLLLQQSVDLGHLILGAVLALLLARLAPAPSTAAAQRHSFEGLVPEDQVIACDEEHQSDQPDPSPLSRLYAGLQLMTVVLIDILRANLEVARQILGPQADLQTAWIEMPLRVQSDRGITLLTHIITMTPGTLSARISSDRRTLSVHALHAPDPQAVIASIQSRYENRVRVLCDRNPAGSQP